MYSTGFEVWKGAVGEQAVEADRDPDRGQQVHDGGDRQVGRAHQAFQRRTIAAIVATKGTTTAPRLAPFSSLVISPMEQVTLSERYISVYAALLR